MNKPLCLILEDANNELVAAVEDIAKRHGLPYYLLEPMVSDVLTKIQNGKRKEIEGARKKYREEEVSDEQ